MHVLADRGILREIQEHFTFEVEGAKFHPKVRNKMWDGKIRLLDLNKQTMYIGLFDELVRFCEARDYEPVYDYSEFSDDEMSLSEATDIVSSFAKDVKIPDFEVRDYQIDTVLHCIRKRRALFLSPTSSGKSFMIHCLIRYYDSPTLLIVDSLGAVHQMAEDLVSYGYDPDDIHKIFGGQDKSVDRKVVISTWQSLLEMPEGFFYKFQVVIGDEAHHFAAKTFIELMEKIKNARYRFGFTGTIKGSKCNSMVLEGLFGKIKSIVTTRELMDQGYIAKLKIDCIVLQYPKEVKDALRGVDYQKEIDFLINSKSRNRFIRNLAGSLNGNTLVFFTRIAHGELLRDEIERSFPDKKVILIHGGVDGEIRNDVRKFIEENDDVIAIVSFGTFQTAISIKNIHNLIFGSPSKSRIRNLQSIGRGLRKGGKNNKAEVSLYDIADNLISGSWKNHTIKHFGERIKIYSEEKFKPKIYNVQLREG